MKLLNIISISRLRGKTALGVYEIPVVLGMLAVLIICIARRSFFISGTVLGASLIAYGLAFSLVSYGLKRQGLGLERLFFAVAGAAAARWLFEIVYHFAFPVSGATVIKNFLNLSTNTSEANFPLIWAVMMVLIIFTGYRYMAAGKWFWITLAVSVIAMFFWIWTGYPQWVHPEQWPVRAPVIWLIPREYIHAPTEAAKSYISLVSLIFNSIAKIVVCAVLPALFWGRKG